MQKLMAEVLSYTEQKSIFLTGTQREGVLNKKP